ncbi:MAG: peptide chain release factor 1 [Leptospirales bacterium]|nr:peptide chain release factor 1 [Leptospirales bacterium]
MIPIKDRLEKELLRISELEDLLAQPDIASNPARFRDLGREHSILLVRKEPIERFLRILNDLEEAEKIIKDSGSDNDLREMAMQEKVELEAALSAGRDEMESLLLPPDPNSGKSVILEIRAGTGGDEAALFAGDLFRMYQRYIERSPLKLDFISSTESDLGGYKEIVFGVDGREAYDLLHQEAGTHRVQRIPVTESGGRIHTSAVTVAVLVEAEEEDITIEEKDLQIDTYRASGAGGQHVNKTDSAIRITHIPSGIVVTCQDERSQLKNKNKAMKVLRAKLAERSRNARHEEQSALKKDQIGSGDRSEKIRTYNFPQSRLTDHRIGYSSHNLPAMLDGDLDDLLRSLLRAERESKLAAV